MEYNEREYEVTKCFKYGVVEKTMIWAESIEGLKRHLLEEWKHSGWQTARIYDISDGRTVALLAFA